MKAELLFLPSFNEVQNAWDYFWYQLPYAIPSFLSFGLGLLLSLVGIGAYFFFKRKVEYLIFSFLTFSYGFLSLVLALRAVVFDESTLLFLHRFLYIPSLFIGVTTTQFFYELTERRYKSLVIANALVIVVSLWAIIELILGTAFLDSWNIFPFGKYPKGNTAIRAWAVVSFACLYFVVLPIVIYYLVKYRKEKSFNWNIYIPLFLFSVLVSTNVPSLLGINFFPGGAFTFIPMLYLAYGTFKKDIFNLNELLYEKNFLFYTISLIISFLFFITSLLIVTYLSPSSQILETERPYFLVPLFSVFVIFVFVVYIAGNSSTEKVWLLSALALMFNGLFAFILTVRALHLPILISQRIEQVIYIFISFGPALQWRIIFYLLKLKGNKVTSILDLSCLFSAILAVTPYFFEGYYIYSFGTNSRSGLGLKILSAATFLTLIYVLYKWYKHYKKVENPFLNYIIAAFVLGGFFLVSGFPSTLGYPIYSLANLQFIPTLFIVRGYFLYGNKVLKGQGYRLSNNIILLVTIGTLVSVLYYYLSIIELTIPSVAIYHVLLLFPPFYLSFFSFVFILIRPIAKKLDENYQQLLETNLELKKTKSQLEGLNRLSNLINSTTDVPIIMSYIYFYMNETFQVEAFWLLGIDEKKQNITTIFSINNFIPNEVHEYYKNYVFPLNSRGGGGFYKVYKTKEMLVWNYDPKFERLIQEGKTIDLQIIRDLRLKILISIPLIVQDKVIAVLSLTSYQENFQFSEHIISQIKIFAEQISGTIYKSKLLKETEEARQLLSRQKQILELQKQEAEDLNILFQELNQDLEISSIMKKFEKFIKKYYDFDYYALNIIDKNRKVMRVLNFSYPENTSQDIIETISKFEIPLDNIVGGHKLVFESKKFFFFRTIDPRYASPEEMFVVENFQIQSILIFPLILQGEVIGLIDLFNEKRLLVRKQQIIKLQHLVSQMAGVIHSAFLYQEVQKEKEKSEKLLLNVLPEEVASQLKEKGYT
ncbi:MAG: GAF domain-containing protein, partial [Leptospiraceae bacterium]|nr:GAF domain-containing protein [Leptospiraceae bacterium]